MNTRIRPAFVALLFAALVVGPGGCGVKQYNGTPTCEDLTLVPLSEMDASTLSDAQLDSIEVYRALEGEWSVEFACLPADGEEVVTVPARLTIEEISDNNVEIYEEQEESDCADVGVAIFEATLSGTGDDDLDDTPFLLTANLLREQETTWDPSNVFMLEASDDGSSSLYPETISFNLKILVDYNGTPVGSKYVVAETPTSDGSTVSQWDQCIIDQWTAL